MTNMNTTPVTGYHKSCPSCGGMLRYDIEQKRLVCASCGSSHSVSIFEDPGEPAPEMEVLEYRCPQCGARLHTTATNMVSYCNYCGSDVQFTQRMTHTRRPDKIIPFRVTREECEANYREYMGRQLRRNQPLNFLPVYVPFYWYQESYEGQMTAQYKTSDCESGYIVTHTIEQGIDTKLIINGEMECASSQFEAETADQLQVKVRDLLPFSPGYLCGFFAEAPDMDPNVEESHLDVFATEMIKTKIYEDVKERVTTLSLPEKTEDKAEVVLVPVWLLAKSVGHRVLYTAVSGISNRIVCDKPVSNTRTFLTAALIGAGLFCLMYLLQFSLILQPNVVISLCALLASVGYFCITAHLTRHALNMQISEKRKESKRCDVLKDQKDVYTLTASQQGWINLMPLVALVCGALFCLMLVASQVVILAYLFLPVAVFTLRSVIVAIKNIVSSHKARKEQSIPITKEGTIREWLLLYGIWPVVVTVVMFLGTWAAENFNAAVDVLVSDRSWLPSAMCIYSAITMCLQLKSAVLDKTDTVLCLLEIALNVLVAFIMPGLTAKWLLHCVTILLLIPLILSMLRINRRHNEFITRPVPFFGEEGVK